MSVGVYLALLLTLSVIAFGAYAVDKKRAIEGRWRLSEGLLLGLSFFGGAIGGYLAMFLVRHKTRKGKFHVVNLLGLVWQLALLIYLFFTR